MVLAWLDPLMLVLGSWALEMLVLGWLPAMAVKRRGPDALRDLRLVWVMVWVMRMFVMLTLLLLAVKCTAASDGSPSLPRNATELEAALQSDQLLAWLRSEHDLVHRMQSILGAMLMYFALQTVALRWLAVYPKLAARPVTAA